MNRSNKLNLRNLNSFAYQKDYTANGVMLVICGKEYEAWHYDSYIYDALHIAGYWDEKEITYERIMWLRDWLRENVQHGHDFPINVRSLSGAKKLIDRIIESEYRGDPMWDEERKFQLEQNAKKFST